MFFRLARGSWEGISCWGIAGPLPGGEVLPLQVDPEGLRFQGEFRLGPVAAHDAFSSAAAFARLVIRQTWFASSSLYEPRRLIMPSKSTR